MGSTKAKTPWHVQVLQKELDNKKSRNEKFSMRAFSRMLDVPAPIISEVLRLKRKLLPKYAEKICQSLAFSEEKEKLFMNSVIQDREGKLPKELLLDKPTRELKEKVLLEGLYSTAIEEWEYFAILSLFKTEDFKESAQWISKRLNITSERAKHVVLDLKKLGLLSRNEEGKLERTHSRITSTLDVPSRSIRKSHEETLSLAKEKLHSVDVSERYYMSETMAIDPEKLDEAKTLIRNFKDSLATLMEEGHQKDVYRLALQLFPLSELSKD